MPSLYFPYGGGLDGDLGNVGNQFVQFSEDPPGEYHTPLLHWNNGSATQTAILRLARAITVTPRQLIKAQVNSVAYPSGNNQTIFGTSTAGGRNMLDPIGNLNAVDAIAKVVSLTIDGLLSRDVQ
jgi:hypothetical protein